MYRYYKLDNPMKQRLIKNQIKDWWRRRNGRPIIMRFEEYQINPYGDKLLSNVELLVEIYKNNAIIIAANDGNWFEVKEWK